MMVRELRSWPPMRETQTEFRTSGLTWLPHALGQDPAEGRAIVLYLFVCLSDNRGHKREREEKAI